MCVVSFSERAWEYRDRFALNLLLNKEILTNLAQVPRDKKNTITVCVQPTCMHIHRTHAYINTYAPVRTTTKIMQVPCAR